MAVNLINYAPPRCPKHRDASMILSFYDRSGGPPGNGWVCAECIEERKSAVEYTKTRFPEGTEL
jgi:hypothetical protein